MSCCRGSCFVCLGVAFLPSGACVITLREGASDCSAGSRRHSADPPRTIRRNWAIFGHWVCTMAASRRDERYLCIGRHKGLFAFKGVGGVGVGRSGPECRWWRGRRAHPAASRAQVRMEGCGGEWFGVPVPRLFLFVGALHPIRRQCTSSVRVHRHVTGAAPPCLWRLWRLSGLWGSSGLELSSAWDLCGASCCSSSEMSHVIPRHVFQTLKSHRWNSAVFSIPMKS